LITANYVVAETPSDRATAARLRSNVQSCAPAISVEARRWASPHPIPRPIKRRPSISRRTSSSSATGACGSRRKCKRISFRFFMLPHASSPTTNGWQRIEASNKCESRSGRRRRKWSTQTDVSARITSLGSIGAVESASIGVQYRQARRGDGHSRGRSVLQARRVPTTSFL